MSRFSGGSSPHGDADLGDALAVVAHPLQLARDVQKGDQRPEVSGRGLLRGYQVDGAFLDVVPLLVDDVVLLDDLSAQLEIAGP